MWKRGDLAMAKVTLMSFSIPSLIERIVIWKIHKARGTIVTISTRDLRVILNIENRGLESLIGKALNEYARKGLLIPIRNGRPKRYIITSRFLEHIFPNITQALSKPPFMLTQIENFYFLLKAKERDEL